MKKILCVLSMVLVFFMGKAETENVAVEYTAKGSASTTIPERTVGIYQIQVIYDNESRLITLISDQDIIATTFVYDADGNVIGSTGWVNSEIEIPEGISGQITIRIEGLDWIGTGTLRI